MHLWPDRSTRARLPSPEVLGLGLWKALYRTGHPLSGGPICSRDYVIMNYQDIYSLGMMQHMLWQVAESTPSLHDPREGVGTPQEPSFRGPKEGVGTPSALSPGCSN